MECREEQHDIQCTMKENGRMGVGRVEGMAVEKRMGVEGGRRVCDIQTYLSI